MSVLHLQSAALISRFVSTLIFLASVTEESTVKNMYNYSVTCITIFMVLILKFGKFSDCYVLPKPRFEVLKPRGIKISIPDEPGIQFFAFQGNINKSITSSQIGDISGETYRSKNGKWTIQNDDINLADGNIINYWIFAQVNGITYKKENQRWTVAHESKEAHDTSTERTTTTFSRLLFNEDFNSLNESIWSRDVRMPLAPDYEFCVYHNEHHELLIQTTDGTLKIKPLILEDYYGEGATGFGTLQLGGCTSNVQAECSRKAMSFNILPPIISARLHTKNSFSFRYGKIEIKAKLSAGDWIFPEIMLKSKYESYGRGYPSGAVILGLIRGNDNLINVSDRTIFDSRRLDFGFRVGPNNNVDNYIVSKIRENGPRWNEDFHVYTTIWNSDGFQFLIDDEEVGRLSPKPDGWLNNANLNKIAPFDEEFYISLGVGVGGIRVFPDGTSSSGVAKPWRNVGAKAMLQFWRAKGEWVPSWRRDSGRKTVLEIDYIRVWSN